MLSTFARSQTHTSASNNTKRILIRVESPNTLKALQGRRARFPQALYHLLFSEDLRGFRCSRSILSVHLYFRSWCGVLSALFLRYFFFIGYGAGAPHKLHVPSQLHSNFFIYAKDRVHLFGAFCLVFFI